MTNKKILVVDDDNTFCLMLQKFLSKNEYEVTTASSGARALQILDAQSFDLILTDYR
jgi:two-component system response regulator HydG